MFFDFRKSTAVSALLVQRTVGVASTLALFGCGIVGNSGSDSANALTSNDDLIATEKVDAARLLLNNVDPVLSFAGTKLNKEAKEADVALPDCSAAKKGKYHALFHNPSALRSSARDAQAIARRSGYFSSQAAAQKAVGDSLSGSLAAGIICLGSSRYAFSLKVNPPTWNEWTSTLTFTGVKGGASGYRSEVTLNLNFSSKTIKAEVSNVKGRFDYHYLSSMVLRSKNGDEDIWNFAPAKAAEDGIAANLKEYLVQWKKDNPLPKQTPQSNEGEEDPEKALVNCNTDKVAQLVAIVNADVQKIFPNVTASKDQANETSGLDKLNFVAAELFVVDEQGARSTFVVNLDKFTLERGNGNRIMRHFFTAPTSGRYELHLTPVVGGSKLPKKAVVKFTLRHDKNAESGICEPRVEDQHRVVGAEGLGAAVWIDNSRKLR